MSDVEEPPTKVTKYEMSQTFTQPDEMEEGQEEWLSEGILTDDDLNPDNAGNQYDPDRTKSDVDSQGVPEEHLEESGHDGEQQVEMLDEEALQEDSLPEEAIQESAQEAMEVPNSEPAGESQENAENDSVPIEGPEKQEEAKLEQTLTGVDVSSRAQDELAAFLTRSDGPQASRAPDAHASDGNDTDDLLRMLEDDDKCKKKLKPLPHTRDKAHAQEQQSSDDDDEYIFHGASVRKLRVAKKTIVGGKFPTKAEPEESSDDDTDEQIAYLMSSEDAAALRSMFSGGRKPPAQATVRRVAKHVVRMGPVAPNFNNVVKKPVTSTPVRQYTNKSLLKTGAAETRAKNVVRLLPEQPSTNERKGKQEPEEIINEEEFLEEDDFDLREDFAESGQEARGRQRIMRPERMDEDVPSDPETNSDDGSLYDELPSSDSDSESWFTLDIRAERAGDYLPLLGARAHALLSAERARVGGRLGALRHHVRALHAPARLQAARLRRATAALADLDDMLRAA